MQVFFLESMHRMPCQVTCFGDTHMLHHRRNNNITYPPLLFTHLTYARRKNRTSNQGKFTFICLVGIGNREKIERTCYVSECEFIRGKKVHVYHINSIYVDILHKPISKKI